MSRTLPQRPGAGPGLDDDRTRDRRTALLAAAGVLVLLLALYGAAVAVVGDQIAAGTRVGDVGIGGLAPREAVTRLRAELRPQAGRPIGVSVAGADAVLDPVAAGMRLDVAATVDRAGGGRTVDPRTLWDALFGEDLVAPVVRVDQDRLIDALQVLAVRTEVAPVEPQVTFDGARPVVQRPRSGSRLDVGPSAVAVLDAWLVDERTVDLPVLRNVPQVDAAGLRAARETVAVLVSGPIALQLPGGEVRLGPDRFAPALSVRVVDGRLRTVVDERSLTRRLARLIRSVERPVRNATVEVVRGRPRVVPARAGIGLAPEGLAGSVLTAASARGSADDARSSRVPRVRTEAPRSTAEARELRRDRVRDWR